MARVILALVCVWLSALLGAAPSVAQGGDRLAIMMTQVVPPGTSPVIFDLSRSQGKVKALRLIASGGDVLIERVIITYSNGQVHYEDRFDNQGNPKPINLLDGERTAEIDPRETIERFVERIEVVVRSSSGPMELQLWARQSPEGRMAQRSKGPPAGVRNILKPGPGGPPPIAKSLPPTAPPRQTQLPPPGATAPPVHKLEAPQPPVDRQKSIKLDDSKPYAEIDVYYGTNRRPEAPRKLADRTLDSYGTGQDPTLWLGKATVSVPKENRDKGQINRPEFDLIVTSFALRGEDPARDFTLLSVGQLSRADFITQARARLAEGKTFAGQAFIFVHGYNVSFDDALFRAAQISYDMDFDGLPLMYSWPSLGGVRGYFLDQRRARASKDGMRQFLDLVATETGATQVHLIAHSMGANPILEALQTYPAAQAGGQPRFSEVILAAPDVLRDDFERIAGIIRGQARGITLFASNNDNALRLSRFTTLGESPAGLVPLNGAPVVIPGVDTIDVSTLNTSIFGLNHSTFSDRETLLADIKAIISDKMRRDPSARLPGYKSVPVPVPAGGQYWRYQP